MISISQFSPKLLQWFESHHRPMPWKGEKNPYLIWLSEIILQQTRVEQGLPYFERFASNYPTVKDLADAPADDIMKMWEGLGYYSRARNLHATAKHIAYQLKGIFPTTYKEILTLKGVGPYTAAAIASFAYDLPHAVVDGNVYRVLSRVFGIQTAIDSTEGKKEFNQLASELINPQRAADYNQAIMDFGATQCTPKSPNCAICPFKKGCIAFNEKRINELPFKSKKIKKTERFLNYFVFNFNNETWISKRTEKDIWQNLYEFPLIETTKTFDLIDIQSSEKWFEMFPKGTKFTISKISKPYKQVLTHRKIIATFVEITIYDELNHFVLKKIPKKDIQEYAFPKVISQYLQDKSLYLELF